MTLVKDKFLRYISFDTQSDPNSNTYPTSNNQLDLQKQLYQECLDMGLSDVSLSEFGYVYATLPSNIEKKVPVIGFIAHADTSPDFSGKNVKPNCIVNYNGEDILLDKESDMYLRVSDFPVLKTLVGQELIVTDGKTLLGGDDKAGIAEIMTAMQLLLNNPHVKHGELKICFTPDEEVGKGADNFDVASFGADFAFTIDGGSVGGLDYENFNAANAKIIITGKSVHPGSAKNILVNASSIAAELISLFPKNETPEQTEGQEGFFHLSRMKGGVSSATVEYLVRDFDKNNFQRRKDFILETVAAMNVKYDNRIEVIIEDNYYNMKETFEGKEYIIEIAKKAIKNIGDEVITSQIRGGTDGARLSYMGLPTPNIYTGGFNGHGPYEFVVCEYMEKAVETIAEIARLGTFL